MKSDPARPGHRALPATRRAVPRADGAAWPRPLVTVDLAIICVHASELQVLLVRRPGIEGANAPPDEPFPGRWALPGGIVDVTVDPSLEACALRKLREKTGVDAPYLEQLGSWGDAERDPRGWSTTHVYVALIPWTELPVDGPAQAAWHPADAAARKRLAFDHGTLLAAALERLRGKVEYTSLPAYLLPEPFTLPELQAAYEVVLGRPLDKSAFRKRMLDGDFLVETGRTDGAFGRAAMGYRIRTRGQAQVFPRTFRSGE